MTLLRGGLKRPFSDGTTHVTFTPEDFMARLAALVPRPRDQGSQPRHEVLRRERHVRRTVAERALQPAAQQGHVAAALDPERAAGRVRPVEVREDLVEHLGAHNRGVLLCRRSGCAGRYEKEAAQGASSEPGG